MNKSSIKINYALQYSRKKDRPNFTPKPFLFFIVILYAIHVIFIWNLLHVKLSF